MHKQQNGFSIPIIIGTIAGIIAISAFGFYIYRENIISRGSSNQNDSCNSSDDDIVRVPCNGDPAKPVIYLYPEKETEISVNLKFDGSLTYTYPEIGKDNTWEVLADPDGKIINKDDNNEYSYLFWEGKSNKGYSIDTGFVVKGEDSNKFLREKLSYLGLNSKEYNEMIVYWAPKLEQNNYNLIHFAQDQYTENAKLEISPEPDSLLRVFMIYKPLDEYQQVEEQKLDTFERRGFTVIEWGGAELY